MTRAVDELMVEIAEIAHQFHWPLGSILDLEHRDRRYFLDAIRSGTNDDDDTWTSDVLA